VRKCKEEKKMERKYKGIDPNIDVVNPLVYDICTTGLEPIKDRIIGITCKTKTEEVIITESDEKQIILRFLTYIQRRNIDAVVGFNNNNFDNIFLRVRALKYASPMYILRRIQFIDMRKIIFNGYEFKKGKLKDFQELFEIEYAESRYTKSDMSVLWDTPDAESLKDFLMQDVRFTWRLYLRAMEVGLI
jgi:DNA polymerase elongation subunit (family B)